MKDSKKSEEYCGPKKKRLSPRKVTIFVGLLTLLLIELGAIFGLGCNVYLYSRINRSQELKTGELARVNNTDTTLRSLEQEKQILGAQSSVSSASQGSFAVPVLMYHHIDTKLEPGNPHAGNLTVSPKLFESHLEHLSKNGFNTISLDELYAALYGGTSLPSKPVLITFDDGYENNYTYAFSLLKKYGKKGTFFMISDYADAPGYLTKAQLKEMSDAGMGIESHTKKHANLAQVDPPTLIVELGASKKALEKIIGKKVNYIAYPFGGYSEYALRAVKSSGYLMGLTINEGKVIEAKEPFRIPRIAIDPSVNLKRFANLLN